MSSSAAPLRRRDDRARRACSASRHAATRSSREHADARAASRPARRSRSGCTFSAWLAGIVHGVVVQITAQTSARPAALRSPNAARELRRARASSSGKPTSIAMSTRSSYSTSASASALPAVEAPVDGLQAAIEEALLEHLAERADLVGLVLEGHRRVRMVPVAQHAEALELRLLPRDLLGRVGARTAAASPRPDRCLPCVFSICTSIGMPWQSQPGTYGASKPASVLALDDDVLQDLVDRVADVDVAVRVRRAVVQHEARAARATRRGSPRRPCAPATPCTQPGSRLREVAAHRKRRVGQVERRLVVGLGFVGHEVAFVCVAGSRRREIVARLRDVGANLARQRVEVGVALLVAQLVQELDARCGGRRSARRSRR